MTQIVIFVKEKLNQNLKFTFRKQTLEIENAYKHHGISLGRTVSYVAAIKHVAEQENNALSSLF